MVMSCLSLPIKRLPTSSWSDRHLCVFNPSLSAEILLFTSKRFGSSLLEAGKFCTCTDLPTNPKDLNGLEICLEKYNSSIFFLTFFYFLPDFVSHIQADALRNVCALLTKGYME